jgi:hypothetical protein
MLSRLVHLIPALLSLTACRQSDWPAHSAPIVLRAFTASVAPGGTTDSIVCSITVSLPIADSVPSAWSGTATVHVSRWTLRGTAGPPKDTLLTDVPIEIAARATDSMRVTIGSPSPIVLDGRIVGTDAAYSRGATGVWRCDDRVPLARLVPGEATGAWHLFVALPID